MEVIAILAVLWSILISVVWLVIGFRAMRAHEDIAERMRLLGKAIESIGTSKSPE